MLIRWVTERDIDAWRALSSEHDDVISPVQPDIGEWYSGFESYMARKIVQHEAVAATNQAASLLGAIAFSRAGNRITFFAVSKSADFHETAQKLLAFALRQLDTGKTISVNVPKSEHEIALAEKAFFERNGFVIYDGNALENGCPVLALARPPSD